MQADEFGESLSRASQKRRMGKHSSYALPRRTCRHATHMGEIVAVTELRNRDDFDPFAAQCERAGDSLVGEEPRRDPAIAVNR